MDHLALYSKNCKICKYLDPDEVKEFSKCHFKNGNTECPAKEVQFAVVGEARRLAAKFKAASTANNIKEQVRILEFVSKRTPAFQHKYREWSRYEN